MFAAIASFFNMLTILFTAGEKAATALNNVAEVAEVKSGSFRDEEIVKARHRLALLNSQAPQLPSPE